MNNFTRPWFRYGDELFFSFSLRHFFLHLSPRFIRAACEVSFVLLVSHYIKTVSASLVWFYSPLGIIFFSKKYIPFMLAAVFFLFSIFTWTLLAHTSLLNCAAASPNISNASNANFNFVKVYFFARDLFEKEMTPWKVSRKKNSNDVISRRAKSLTLSEIFQVRFQWKTARKNT